MTQEGWRTDENGCRVLCFLFIFQSFCGLFVCLSLRQGLWALSGLNCLDQAGLQLIEIHLPLLTAVLGWPACAMPVQPHNSFEEQKRIGCSMLDWSIG